jgi:hypothetical protein
LLVGSRLVEGVAGWFGGDPLVNEELKRNGKISKDSTLRPQWK